MEFVENSIEARKILLAEGLLEALHRQDPGSGPRMRMAMKRGSRHYVCGLLFSGYVQKDQNGYAVIRAELKNCSPLRWGALVAEIIGSIGKIDTVEAELFELVGEAGLN